MNRITEPFTEEEYSESLNQPLVFPAVFYFSDGQSSE